MAAVSRRPIRWLPTPLDPSYVPTGAIGLARETLARRRGGLCECDLSPPCATGTGFPGRTDTTSAPLDEGAMANDVRGRRPHDDAAILSECGYQTPRGPTQATWRLDPFGRGRSVASGLRGGNLGCLLEVRASSRPSQTESPMCNPMCGGPRVAPGVASEEWQLLRLPGARSTRTRPSNRGRCTWWSPAHAQRPP